MSDKPRRAGQAERDLDREAAAARDLLAHIASDGDDALSADMVEGETGLYEAIETALAEMDEADAMVEGVTALMEKYEARRAALGRRKERLRSAIEQAMAVSGLPSIRLPAATLTIKDTPPKAIITDENLIPAEFWKPRDPSLDKAAINAAAKVGDVPGVTMSNGGVSLQVRRK